MNRSLKGTRKEAEVAAMYHAAGWDTEHRRRGKGTRDFFGVGDVMAMDGRSLIIIQVCAHHDLAAHRHRIEVRFPLGEQMPPGVRVVIWAYDAPVNGWSRWDWMPESSTGWWGPWARVPRAEEPREAIWARDRREEREQRRAEGAALEADAARESALPGEGSVVE